MSWRIAPIVVVAALLCALGPSPASASGAPAERPSQNGLLAFGREDPAIGGFSLWVARSNGTGQRRITDGQAYFPDWSPDGSRIAFDFPDETGEHIATIAPDGTEQRVLTTAAGVQEAADWSPDGRTIAYNAFTSFDADPFTISIWTMRSDGTQPRRITDGAIDVEPVFSPDGSKIAFGRIGAESPAGQLEALYVVNADGSGLREVVPARAGLEHPDWSPDGRSIVFNIAPESPTAPDAGSVLSVRPSGEGLRVIVPATTRFGFFKPTWSPDGRKLLVGCYDRNAGSDRLCMTSASGNARVIVGGSTPVNYPSWGARQKKDR